MAYRKNLVDDKFIFIIGDNNILELTSYDKVKEFSELSNNNLETLINEIKEEIVLSVNEELGLMESNNGQLLLKTVAYVKLMQSVGQFLYVQEQNRVLAEREERIKNGSIEEQV